MNSDFKNYFLKLRNPKFAYYSFLYFQKALFKKIKRLISYNNHFDDFKLIKSHRDDILCNWNIKIDIIPPIFKKSFELKLVTGSKRLKSSNDWHIRYDDAEMNVSIDRWSWLLLGLSNKIFPFDYDDGLFLIRSWSSEFINDENLARQEPYSIGERISNGILFFKLNKYTIPEDIILIFEKLTFQLVKNLEYYPNDLTGNHAFNNARALYLISDLIINKNIKFLALEIANERLNTLISADGFLREGSSNYQFIFTRWVLEMVWNAKELRDHKTLKILLPFAKKLLKQCWFFLLYDKFNKNWNYPLFGDVSPDCPPSWLISLTWSKIAINIYKPKNIPLAPKNIGWAKLFGGITDKHSSKNNLKINFSSACGWHRIEFFDWTIFTHAPLKETQLRATHSHLDLCSFVLYLKGKPIIIDIGRYDYTNSYLSKYCKSTKAHNSLIINELGPETELFSWTNPSYSKININLTIEKSLNKIFIKINHDGYKRFVKQKIKHERNIILNKKNVIIEDFIKGNGNVIVNNFFNFGPDLNLLKIDDKIMKLSNQLNFKINGDSIKTNKSEKETSGWFFPSYGVKVPIIHLETKTEKSLPLTIINEIILNK